MPVFKRPDADLYYEVHGSGFPLLLFANGGLTESCVEKWRDGRDPKTGKANLRVNPMTELSDRFTVIAMDQRNCGKSRGAVKADHGWHTYAEDHLALMDHLGFARFHTMGVCIGGSFIFALCRLAPERQVAAVVNNPIGLHDNRDHWNDMVESYGRIVRERDSSVTQQDVDSLGRNLFGGDLVFSVDRDFVRACATPLLLQPGSDSSHPKVVSDELARLAPNMAVQDSWRGPEHLEAANRMVRDFLTAHTPAP